MELPTLPKDTVQQQNVKEMLNSLTKEQLIDFIIAKGLEEDEMIM